MPSRNFDDSVPVLWESKFRTSPHFSSVSCSCQLVDTYIRSTLVMPQLLALNFVAMIMSGALVGSTCEVVGAPSDAGGAPYDVIVLP